MTRIVRWFGGIVAGWMAWRVLGPELQPSFGKEQRRPIRVPGRTVFVGDKEFFVREIGPVDAPPIVLLHGWSLDGEMTFYRVIPLLAERFRVVVPDHRAHGKSEWVRGRVEMSDLADELAAVLDAIGCGPATVVGYSMGGLVAQELARRHPRHIAKLVLAATAARPVAERRVPTRVMFFLGRTLLRISRYEASMATTRVLRRTGSLNREHQRWMWESLMRRDPTLYAEMGLAVFHFDSRPWIGRLKLPTMVIIPTDDQMIAPRAQYELASLVADADIVELVGAGHEAVMNRADELVKHIADFAG